MGPLVFDLVLDVICLVLDLVLGVTTLVLNLMLYVSALLLDFGVVYGWFGAEWCGLWC